MKKKPVRIVILLGVTLGAAGCVMSPAQTGPVGLPSKTVTTLAGQTGVMGSTDATGTAASFGFPAGAVVLGTNLYVCDSFNSTIREISLSTGAVTTIAGAAGVAGYYDNTPTPTLDSYFNHPEGITTDGTSLYVADSGNGLVRKLTLTTGVWLASTVAGGFANPLGICFLGGNLYIADALDCTIDVVAATGGTVNLVAGQPGVEGSSDGIGAGASFTFPEDLAAVGTTTLYVVDTGNHTVRLVTTAGAVTTFAGQAGVKGDTDGTGTAAQFNWPEGIATDGTNLYVADTLNNVIRQIVISTHVVTTLAGQGETAGSTNGAGNVATFNHPMKLAWYATSSSLPVSDTYNETIREVK